MTSKWVATYKFCEKCSKSFLPKTAQQKFCSPLCRETEANRKLVGNKFIIFQRDGFRCAYCGATPTEDGVKLVLDHLHPYSKGGEHTASNLITCCNRCNNSKHAKILPKDILDSFSKYISEANEKSNIPSDKVIEGSHTYRKPLQRH